MDDPSTRLIQFLYTSVSNCEKTLFFNNKKLDKMRRKNPYFNMVCRKEGGFYDRVIPSGYTARQQVPECLDMNASIYVYARNYLMDMCAENRRALVWKMENSVVLDIDSEIDFELMEILTQYYWEHGKYLNIK